MNYSELSDFEINRRVVVGMGWELDEELTHNGKVFAIRNNESSPRKFDLNNPSDAWSVIVENKIAIRPALLHDLSDGSVAVMDKWEAYADSNTYSVVMVEHMNPFRAAMIVFLIMKEGE